MRKIGLIDAGDSKTAGAHIILYIIGIDFITQFQMKLVGNSAAHQYLIGRGSIRENRNFPFLQ